MPVTKPTLVLLHGAFHPPSAWDRVIKHLSAKGYRCIAPQLLFVGGTGQSPKTWEPIVAEVQTIIREEVSSGRDVVIVNHSLGGLAGCSAVEGFTKANPTKLKEGNGSILAIVQITGMTIRDAAHHTEVFEKIPSNPDENGWQAVPLGMVKHAFYHDLEPEDADYWASQLLPQSGWINQSSQGLYPGYKDVPVWYLLCDKDQMLPPPLQQNFCDVIREVNERLTTRHIDSAHSAILNKSEETADFIDDAVKSVSA